MAKDEILTHHDVCEAVEGDGYLAGKAEREAEDAEAETETIRPPARKRQPAILPSPSQLLKPSIRNRTIRTAFRKRSPDFHLFSKLPMEIRLQIWEHSMVPRVHELHPCAKLYNERMTFRSNSAQTPTIFHVNRESRSVAMKNYQLMEYDPTRGLSGKGILRFFFNPVLDTLLLNSLMGLFMMFVLLEEEVEYAGTMRGWQTVAFDAERAQLITLLSGIHGHRPQPRIKEIFPSLKQLIIAFDYTSRGKTRFRTSVWPGENGTTLKEFPWPVMESREFETIFEPMKSYLENDYTEGDVPEIQVAKVKRKVFLRGDIRYAFRKTCAVMGMRPRGIFRRI
ncbi:hypothetical protein GLAREA_09613 [Glarea lozoyensis ATCC 20868]|uniref:2EXR domain-containing protein n=1 Tax=Glarea lozoyensis (strain ATCC 20868 / MF5171) TaxID=1116229 RepID=S3CPT2_GLAL2|nr:uncharacterized protein GLAREA_09613 [Glarea lozoyensis ATCC 20868]EPE28492.1 hypothetical protein GLAREA_09613 [Glarea lozoyensis ATCC 20868]